MSIDIILNYQKIWNSNQSAQFKGVRRMNVLLSDQVNIDSIMNKVNFMMSLRHHDSRNLIPFIIKLNRNGCSSRSCCDVYTKAFLCSFCLSFTVAFVLCLGIYSVLISFGFVDQ